MHQIGKKKTHYRLLERMNGLSIRNGEMCVDFAAQIMQHKQKSGYYRSMRFLLQIEMEELRHEAADKHFSF